MVCRGRFRGINWLELLGFRTFKIVVCSRMEIFTRQHEMQLEALSCRVKRFVMTTVVGQQNDGAGTGGAGQRKADHRMRGQRLGLD